MSTTFNAIHYLPIDLYFCFHLNSSFKCNIMHNMYMLALALSSICQNLGCHEIER